MHLARPLLALAVLLVPASASAAPPKAAGTHPTRTARIHKQDRPEKADKADAADKPEKDSADDKTARPGKPDKADKPEKTAKADKPAAKGCLKSPVEILGAGESATFSLSKCDGSAAPLAIDQLSVLARAVAAARPKVTVETLSHAHGREIAPGIRRLDARLLERIEAAVDHFRKAGQTPKITLYSGYRPKSAGSFHQTGRALDLRIDGVSNEELVAFCKTLPDTGCGYYPNSLFVHFDVRDRGAGHVSWIDASKPGEPPRYVSAWPPPPAEQALKLPGLPADEQDLASREAGPLSRQDEKGRRLDRHPYVF
jgi:uncharacterized protein YcbK (DUF882 family)